MDVGLDQHYRYTSPSLRHVDGSVGLATSGGVELARDELVAVESPYFFAGFAEYAADLASALLMIGRVARTRFYTPPGLLARLVTDPVVTCTRDGLRFEAFSSCGGVYARLDVDAAALDTDHVASGITNVDLGEQMRAVLAGVGGGMPLRLTIGRDELTVETVTAEAVERRVTLPERWVRGFAETQVALATMSERWTMDAASARRFVRALPRATTSRSVLWATPAAAGARLSTIQSPDAAPLAGAERLRVLEPLLTSARSLTALASDRHPGTSAWVLEIPGGRVTVALSASSARGFSGEGGALDDGIDDDTTDLVRQSLLLDARIDVTTLSELVDVSAGDVAVAFDRLAARGELGFDLGSASYFHRPLPFVRPPRHLVHPRIKRARELVATRHGEGFLVGSRGAEHFVTLAENADTCSCPWFATYRGERGPCSHVLAARMAIA
jgi:hypothetical protein